MRYLIVWADYMSTGIRDEFSGPIEPKELGFDESLTRQLTEWVAQYEKITPLNEEERTSRLNEISLLDEEGINIVKAIRGVLGNEVKVSYFSEGLLKKLHI